MKQSQFWDRLRISKKCQLLQISCGQQMENSRANNEEGFYDAWLFPFG